MSIINENKLIHLIDMKVEKRMRQYKKDVNLLWKHLNKLREDFYIQISERRLKK